MGREIRRVPPNWEHPKDERGNYLPMHDKDFETAASEWIEEFNQWEAGTHEHQRAYPKECADCQHYWQWAGDPPDEELYRPKFEVEPTWYQMYETVSEGTPVTPPFETKEELTDYLVDHGTFWDQSRGEGGWSRVAAEQFVKNEWAPSMVVTQGKIFTARDGFPE